MTNTNEIVKEFKFSQPIHLENGETLKNDSQIVIKKKVQDNKITWIVAARYNNKPLIINEWDHYHEAEHDFTNRVLNSLNDDIHYNFSAVPKSTRVKF